MSLNIVLLFSVIECSVSFTNNLKPYIPTPVLCDIDTMSSSLITDNCFEINPKPSLFNALYVPLTTSTKLCTVPVSGLNFISCADGLKVT